MKILITGSLGHIGSRIIPLFPDRFELKLTDVREGSVAGIPVSSLDITDYDAVFEASKDVDAILHLAIVSTREVVLGDKAGFEMDQGEDYLKFNDLALETNVRGTYHVFEAARQNGVSRVVYGSSLTVFNGTPRYDAIHDDLPPRPSNFYAVTKLWGEHLGEYFSRKHGIRIYCLRFGTPHPQATHSRYRLWLQGPVAKRNFVTYADLAGAVIAALTAEGPQFGAYTIISAGPASIYNLSKTVEIEWQPQDFIEEDGSVNPSYREAPQLRPVCQ